MIRPAKTEESRILTEISFQSKKYWNYPNAYLETWKDELTVTPQYIRDNDVHVFEKGGEPVGYYAIVELESDLETAGVKLEKGFWLDHMFIRPDFIGTGIGKKLFDHLVKQCKIRRIEELKILADPNARAFYVKMGCRYIKEHPSTIKNRTTPLLELKIR